MTSITASAGINVVSTGCHVQLAGLKIYERRWTPQQSKCNDMVFLCHGFAEHCGYFHQLAEPLAAAGLLVVGHDFYGHGLSEGNVNQLRSVDTFVEVAAAHLAQLKKEFPEAAMYGVGYSMGAIVLHRLCSRSPQCLSAMVWLSPALQPAGLKLTKRRVQLGKWLLQRLPNLPLPGGRFRPVDLTRNKETQEQIANDASIKQRVLYTHVCAWMLEAMQATKPDSVSVPTLVLTGSADRIADAARSAAYVAVGQAQGRPVSGKVYPGGHHQLHTDLSTAGVKLHVDVMQWFAATVSKD